VPGRTCSERFAKRFEQKMTDAYSEKELDAIALRTEFKMRKSKLSPRMFVDTVLFKQMDNASVSLEDHCIELKQRYGVNIKKQSLAERFDASAVKFIQALLNRQLVNQISSTIEREKLGNVFKHFSSVKIKDSTRFQIPECNKEYYPGSTGAATGAGVHIQFEFDILNGTVNDLAVTDALQQDMTDARQTMETIEKGSLIIRDLGYFSTEVLEHTHQQEAYYITRAKARMNFIHAQTGEYVDFEEVYRKMKRAKLSKMELPITFGDKKYPNRLIAEILPENEVQKRLAKARREAEKKGRTLSDEYKCRARLNLFITNIPAEWIPTQQVRQIYRLRWQIEFRFKAWKSFYDLDATKKMQRYRFECYLYSTLLILMINLEIAANFFGILWHNTSKPLSLLKFYKTTSQHAALLRAGVMKKGNELSKYLAFLYEISYEKLLVEKRKHHSDGLEEILVSNLIA
jgi:hypothetical protein